MNCGHQGVHTISSSYDRETRVLTWFRRCHECGARLSDVRRLAYEPHFDPNGNDRFLGRDGPPSEAGVGEPTFAR